MNDWYYNKWIKKVQAELPNVEIESIRPSVWYKKHIQIVYVQNKKRFCLEIPEENKSERTKSESTMKKSC